MEPRKIYHLYTHANGSENLFRNEENFRYFLKRYEEFIAGVADTLAWCLMPNHLHLLVRVKSESELKAFFKDKILKQDQPGLAGGSNKDLSGLVILQFSHLFNAYTKAYNKVYNRRGSLFIRAFKRKEITSNSYYTNIICYIHNNPVHHGFTTQLVSWQWSSYHDFLLPNVLPLQQEVIDWFGNRQQFIQSHQHVHAIPGLEYD
jgi:putative transposase